MENYDQRKIYQFMSFMTSVEKEEIRLADYLKILRKIKTDSFSLTCEGNYYDQAQLPSRLMCDLWLNENMISKNGDQWILTIDDPRLSTDIYNSLSGEGPSKRLFSTDKRWAFNAKRKREYFFVYSLACTSTKCEFAVLAN